MLDAVQKQVRFRRFFGHVAEAMWRKHAMALPQVAQLLINEGSNLLRLKVIVITVDVRSFATCCRRRSGLQKAAVPWGDACSGRRTSRVHDCEQGSELGFLLPGPLLTVCEPWKAPCLERR